MRPIAPGLATRSPTISRRWRTAWTLPLSVSTGTRILPWLEVFPPPNGTGLPASRSRATFSIRPTGETQSGSFHWGASGHPGSPHYADQAELWAEVEFIPQLWDWDEVEEKAESRQILTPG